jgi:hypothetical protein
MKMGGRIKHGQGGEIGGFPEMGKRPGKKVSGVAPTPRSAMMPRPTKDTKYTRKG